MSEFPSHLTGTPSSTGNSDHTSRSRSRRSRWARVATATALGLGTMAGSMVTAHAAPNTAATSTMKPGTHIPATALTARQLAANPCYIGGPDDSVLIFLRKVSNSRGVSAKVRLAVFETAWVESRANSLPCGDSDSQGVFQQRPSQGWGTSAEVQKVIYATNKFLSGNGTAGAIGVAAAHPSWTAGEISQHVQGSAYPTRYDKAKKTAQSLIARSDKLAAGQIAAGHYTWPDVQIGEHNNRVRALQLLLNQHGAKLAADGIYGTKTKAAVSAFQSSHGLGHDGAVGPQTWPKLPVSLKPGSTGYAVRALQRQLNVHGYKLSVNGRYDTRTAAAVASFRHAHKLPKGNVDLKFWNLMIAITR